MSSSFHTFHVLFSFSTLILLLASDYFVRINSESINGSFVNGFLPAVATWYNSPTGPGSGGACGFGNDVGKPPYYGFIAAGNNNIFKSGKGCGTCYQVKCIGNNLCSGYPITLTITDECPGACNNEAFHFDLSGIAFGALAKPGQGSNLRQYGRINVVYQRVDCNYYKTGIIVKVDISSNRYYLDLVIEGLNKDGDIASVQLSSPNSNGWLSMQQTWGENWKVGLPNQIRGPYSLRLTTIQTRKTVVLPNIIPVNWAPGQYYYSKINL